MNFRNFHPYINFIMNSKLLYWNYSFKLINLASITSIYMILVKYFFNILSSWVVGFFFVPFFAQNYYYNLKILYHYYFLIFENFIIKHQCLFHHCILLTSYDMGLKNLCQRNYLINLFYNYSTSYILFLLIYYYFFLEFILL